MKYIVLIILYHFLTGCTHTYTIGVDENAPDSEVTVISFSEQLKVIAIDGKPFSSNATIPGYGYEDTHTIKMQPGKHNFKFKYDGIVGYTKRSTELTEYLKAGSRYELYFIVYDQLVHFGIREITANSPKIYEAMFGDTCYRIDYQSRVNAINYLEKYYKTRFKIDQTSNMDQSHLVEEASNYLTEAAKIGKPKAFAEKCSNTMNANIDPEKRNEDIAWCKVGLNRVPIVNKLVSERVKQKVNQSFNMIVESKIENLLCDINSLRKEDFDS